MAKDAVPEPKKRGKLRDNATRGRPVVRLHIYDVTGESAVQRVNNVLRPVGVGIYHAGVEVLGEEWSFGYSAGDDSGVFSCAPKRNNQHRYRESLAMGVSKLSAPEIEQLLERLEQEWPGKGYDLLSRNCCHFSNALCRGLGVGDIPEWITTLAGAGATVRTGVDQAAVAAQTAARRAAEEAERLNTRYHIASSIDEMATRRIEIDEDSVGATMQAVWLRAAERVGWVGALAEGWFDEAQKPTSFDPKAVEETAESLWTWAMSRREPAAVEDGAAHGRPEAPAPRSEGARCREVLLAQHSPEPESPACSRQGSPRSPAAERPPIVGGGREVPPPPLSLVGAKEDEDGSRRAAAELIHHVARPTLPASGTSEAHRLGPKVESDSGTTSFHCPHSNEGVAQPLVSQPVPVTWTIGPQDVGSKSEAAQNGAKRQAEFAASALDFDDVSTARKCICFALRSLEAPEAAILGVEADAEVKPAAAATQLPARVRREARQRAEAAAESLSAGDAAAGARCLREAMDLLAETLQ